MPIALPPYAWMVLAGLLVTQATWIYRDARRRQEKHAWGWGLFGLINAPGSLLVYLLVMRRLRKERP